MDAKVVIGAEVSDVLTAAETVKAAFRGVGGVIGGAVTTAARDMVTSFSEIALSAGKVNFASQRQSVLEFEGSTARMATAMGADLTSVRSGIEATGVALGKRPQEVAAWAREVGSLTYDLDGAGKSMKGMAQLAALTGRNVEEYRGLAIELGTVGKVSGDTEHAVGALKVQADLLGTSGGVAAFADQIAGLGEAISHFAIHSEADFLKVTALAGEMGKGLTAQQAARVSQSALGQFAADPVGWSRVVGHDITDEHGEIKDPAKVMQQIVEKIKAKHGKDAKRMLQIDFGAETGAALFNTDFGHAAGVAAASNASPSALPAGKLDALLKTDAGQRDTAQAKLAVASDALLGSSSNLGQAADALQRFSAEHPVASTFAATAATAGISSALGGIFAGATAAGGQATSAIVSLGGSALGTSTALGTATGALGIFGAGLAGFKIGEVMGQWLLDHTGIDDKDNPELHKLNTDIYNAKQERDEERARHGYKPIGRAAGPAEAPAGQGGIDPDELQRAIANGMSGVTIQISTSPETPVTATVKTSQSGAAGNQQ